MKYKFVFPLYSRVKIVFLFFLTINFYNSQSYSPAELDRISRDFNITGNIEKGLKLNLKALEEYQKADNEEGIISAYLNIANFLCSLNQYNESLKYLDLAKEKIKKTMNGLIQDCITNMQKTILC